MPSLTQSTSISNASLDRMVTPRPRGRDTMSRKRLMTLEEYLHTSFEGADCEFLDGQVVERNMGEPSHAGVQRALLRLDDEYAHLDLLALPEVRVRITPTRIRIPDVAVWLAGYEVFDTIPNVPPFLAIEVFSPDDRMSRMREKIQEYLQWGVAYVWLIDPYKRAAWCYTKAAPAGVIADKGLSTRDPVIEVPLEKLFARLPKPGARTRKG